MTDLLFLPANEIARLIRTRQVSACQTVEACLRQIETHNPRLNAIVTLDAEGALHQAREADEALARGAVWGSLHGVPFTVKDALSTAGHCNPFNLTGSPVVVMPAGRTASRLPIGIQLVGRRFQDAALLAVTERLEEVIGTFQAPPGYQS